MRVGGEGGTFGRNQAVLASTGCTPGLTSSASSSSSTPIPNGSTPVSSWKQITPSAHTSIAELYLKRVRLSWCQERNISGAM